MPSQPSLDLEVPSVLRSPAEDRPEPLFWFREVRLLSDFSSKNEHLIRSIPFRRGLNIVWSPPSGIDESGNQRIAGHASGKTALCRLLRGLLGEERLGTPETVESIRDAFPDGWVVASVRVEGKDWCVGRPFAFLRRPRAVAGGDLDAFLSDEKSPNRWSDYQGALKCAARRIVPLDGLPGLGELEPWHFFPWFTRDQDAQYMKLYEWRDNSISESESPFLNQEQKGIVLRAVLSIGSAEESRLLEERRNLDARRERTVANRQYCARIVKEDSVRIAEAYGDASLEQFTDPLFAARLADLLERERKAILAETVSDAKVAELRSDLDRVVMELANATQQRNAAARAYERERQVYLELARKEGQKPERSEIEETIKALAAENPGNQFCCAPIDVALQENCPLARRYHAGTDGEFEKKLTAVSKNPVTLVSQLSRTRKLRQAFDNWNERVTRLAAEKNGIRESLETRQNEIRSDCLERADEKAYLSALVKRYSEESDNLEKAERDCKDVEARAGEISDSLKASREKAKEALSDLKAVYDEIVRFLLGTDLGGTCTMNDGQIRARCLYRGNAYTSAALNAVSVVGFDYAAMALSCQGQSLHPRFLLHDGPRVADLSASIYRRYFEFIRHLESLAGSREPNFQYIVTTTEAPPPDLQDPPILVCKLDSSLPDGAGRLFKRNLIQS